MSTRAIAIIGAIALGVAILGPYVGVHLLTSPPRSIEGRPAPGTLRDGGRRPPLTGRPAQERLSPRTTETGQSQRRDLTAIEDLLNRPPASVEPIDPAE